MADLFRLSGRWRVDPASGSPSGDASPEAIFDDAVYLKTKELVEYTLASDAVQSVSFGGVAAAHVIVIRSFGGKVRARLTSADGSQQSVPVDPVLQLISLTTPVTAIDVTRVTGVSTIVKVLLGEKQ